MDPTRESTYKFLDTFLGEMAAIFPDHFMHIGGDENNGVEWKANPHIQAFMREHKLEDTAALQNYFNQRLLKILEKRQRMVGWDEILHSGFAEGHCCSELAWLRLAGRRSQERIQQHSLSRLLFESNEHRRRALCGGSIASNERPDS